MYSVICRDQHLQGIHCLRILLQTTFCGSENRFNYRQKLKGEKGLHQSNRNILEAEEQLTPVTFLSEPENFCAE